MYGPIFALKDSADWMAQNVPVMQVRPEWRVSIGDFGVVRAWLLSSQISSILLIEELCSRAALYSRSTARQSIFGRCSGCNSVPDARELAPRLPAIENVALLGLPFPGREQAGQRRRLVRLHRLYSVRDGSLCGEAASCCVGLADLFVGWQRRWISKFQTAAYVAGLSCQRIRRIITMSETRHV